jgi:hypothetical protein
VKVPLFKGPIATTTTKYIGVPIHDGALGLYIAWLDGTSAATLTLELSSFGAVDAPVETAGTYQWVDSGETITGPAASAAGAAMVNLMNVRQARARLKIVTTANSVFEVYDGVTGGSGR